MFADEFLQESLDHLINNSLETKLFVKSCQSMHMVCKEVIRSVN